MRVRERGVRERGRERLPTSWSRFSGAKSEEAYMDCTMNLCFDLSTDVKSIDGCNITETQRNKTCSSP